jgi:predicted NAD/FAD-dependent oxidoreductase
MASGAEEGPFDAVVSTAPAPQSKALLMVDADMADALATVEIAPCWALMLSFDERLAVDFDVWRSTAGSLAWLCRNSAKPGRATDKEGWVVHASANWSRQHLEKERDWIVEEMTGMFAMLVSATLPDINYASVHRWRYALTTKPLGAAFIRSADGTLFAGGDWCRGARVEAAYESGLAIADALIRDL